MGDAEGRGEGFVPNVFEQLEGGWSQAAVAVQDERKEGAARFLGIGAVLGYLVLLPLDHGFARSHVDVGGGVWG